MKRPGNLKGTWPQALVSFFFPILLVLGVRWAVLEPFVIPSGSMIPNLLIHDHVFVKKFAYGLHLPFSDRWLWRWSEPQAGDVVVFRFPDNPNVFYIKRLIGRPGDRVVVTDGRIQVNGQPWKLDPTASLDLDESEEDTDSTPQFSYFVEEGGLPHVVRFRNPIGQDGEPREWVVPEGSYFFMGDNRDQSSDGRVWGFVPEKNLIGKAWFIWLSCNEMLESARFVCNPTSIRWDRIFRAVVPSEL